MLSTAHEKDPFDVLNGAGQFISQEAYTKDLTDGKNGDIKIKMMRKDYYEDDGSKITVNGFDKDKYVFSVDKKYYSGNTLKLSKKKDSYGTFDDGLLY